MNILLTVLASVNLFMAAPINDEAKAGGAFIAALKSNDESAICDAMEQLAQFDGELAAGL